MDSLTPQGRLKRIQRIQRIRRIRMGAVDSLTAQGGLKSPRDEWVRKLRIAEPTLRRPRRPQRHRIERSGLRSDPTYVGHSEGSRGDGCGDGCPWLAWVESSSDRPTSGLAPAQLLSEEGSFHDTTGGTGLNPARRARSRFRRWSNPVQTTVQRSRLDCRCPAAAAGHIEHGALCPLPTGSRTKYTD
jgi:hypothetical protein